MERTEIQIDKLLWPQLFEPGGPYNKYGLAFDIKHLPQDMREGVYIKATGEVNVSSNFPPYILEVNGLYGRLLRLFEICKACNISRNTLFRDIPASLTLSMYDRAKSRPNDTHPEVTRGISCASVRVDWKDLQRNLEAL